LDDPSAIPFSCLYERIRVPFTKESSQGFQFGLPQATLVFVLICTPEEETAAARTKGHEANQFFRANHANSNLNHRINI